MTSAAALAPMILATGTSWQSPLMDEGYPPTFESAITVDAPEAVPFDAPVVYTPTGKPVPQVPQNQIEEEKPKPKRYIYAPFTVGGSIAVGGGSTLINFGGDVEAGLVFRKDGERGIHRVSLTAVGGGMVYGAAGLMGVGGAASYYEVKTNVDLIPVHGDGAFGLFGGYGKFLAGDGEVSSSDYAAATFTSSMYEIGIETIGSLPKFENSTGSIGLGLKYLVSDGGSYGDGFIISLQIGADIDFPRYKISP